MYQIHYLNPISPKGTALWNEGYQLSDNISLAFEEIFSAAVKNFTAFNDYIEHFSPI